MRNNRLGILAGLSCIAALLLLGTAQAAFLEGKGTVSGTVTDESGKPVVGLALRLEKQIPLEAGARGGKKGSKGKSGFGNGDPNDLQSAKERVKIVAKGVTDAQGKFNWPNIDEGSYTLVGGSQKVGWIYQEVSVTANQDTKIDDLKLVKVK